MASLSDIVKGIQSTNELLVQNVKGQNRTAAMITAFVTGQQSSFGDRLEAGREKGKSTKATAQPVKGSGGGGFKAGAMKGSGLGALASFGGKLIGILFGGIAGAALLSSIGFAAGTAFGALTVGAVGVTLLQTFGEGIIEKLFDTLDPKSVIFDEAQKTSIGKALTDALSIAVVGFIVGGVLGVGKAKVGAAFFLGSLLKDVFLSFLTPEKQKDMTKQIIDKGTFESKFFEGISGFITPELFLTLGATIASFFGLGAIRAGIMMAFTGGAGVVGAVAGKNATVDRNSKGQFTKLRPGLKKSFFKGFGMRLGLGLMLLSVGQSLGNQIAALTGQEDLAGFAQGAINATIVAGMLGGPYAALIVAIGGLAVFGFNWIRNWVKDKNKKIANDLEAEVVRAEEAVIRNNNAFNRKQLRRAELRQAANFRRNQELGILNKKKEIARLENKIGVKLNRANPSASDFYADSKRSFYTGDPNQRDLNPYNFGTEDFISFQNAAMANASNRLDRGKEGNSFFNRNEFQDPSKFNAPTVVEKLIRKIRLHDDTRQHIRDRMFESEMRARLRDLRDAGFTPADIREQGMSHTTVVAGGSGMKSIDFNNLTPHPDAIFLNK